MLPQVKLVLLVTIACATEQGGILRKSFIGVNPRSRETEQVVGIGSALVMCGMVVLVRSTDKLGLSPR